MNVEQMLLRGAPITALAHELAGPWLAQTVDAGRPVGPRAGLGDVRIEPGERYAVLRGLAVMPICGMLTPASEMLERCLGWATYAGIEAAAQELAADDGVSAVVLDVNSPGGLVLGLAQAVTAVRRLAAVKPVHVLVNPLATSAAYWIAAQAGSITMVPGARVGSIGIVVTASVPVQPDEDGVQSVIVTSSHARGKCPDPTTEIGRAELQRQVDELEAQFLADVAQGRGLDAATLPAALSVTNDPADGGAHFGYAAAQGRGLADAEASRTAFFEAMFDRYAVKPRPASGARAFLATARAAQAQAAG